VEFTNADEGLAVVGVVAPAAEEEPAEEAEEVAEEAAAEG
jgi:ferredoxin